MYAIHELCAPPDIRFRMPRSFQFFQCFPELLLITCKPSVQRQCWNNNWTVLCRKNSVSLSEWWERVKVTEEEGLVGWYMVYVCHWAFSYWHMIYCFPALFWRPIKSNTFSCLIVRNTSAVAVCRSCKSKSKSYSPALPHPKVSTRFL